MLIDQDIMVILQRNMLSSIKTFKTIMRFYYSKGKNKHYDPRFSKLRADSVIKVDLPSYTKQRERQSMDVAARREFFRKEGLPQETSFNYMPINLSSTGELMEPYVPRKEDGKSTSIQSGIHHKLGDLMSKGYNIKHVRKIREFEESFDPDYFCTLAKESYINAYDALMQRDADKLHDLVTEFSYVPFVSSIENKSLEWKWVRSLQAPSIVQIRTGEMMSKKMVFAQITMRFFYKQILALYDRFGRILYGNPDLEQDALEFVVFERLLSNPYSNWRLHGKITPHWMIDRSERWHHRTFICPPALELNKIDDNEGDKT
ncbi:hypothetical protein GJ496_001842 [Pomphorhynchus laevis]|nr:hypothetical protein GJ496_001842 [Pomphorhynchus laevis]